MGFSTRLSFVVAVLGTDAPIRWHSSGKGGIGHRLDLLHRSHLLHLLLLLATTPRVQHTRSRAMVERQVCGGKDSEKSQPRDRSNCLRMSRNFHQVITVLDTILGAFS